MKKIDCNKCDKQHTCCETGSWADLEEAKKILELGLKGDFFHLEKDKNFPSGYKVGTSYEYNGCSFLTKDGLCSIHSVSYELKPQTCKDFPYEKGKIAPFVEEICHLVKTNKVQLKKKRKNKK
jgi:Fe-S-cluster containining protein